MSTISKLIVLFSMSLFQLLVKGGPFVWPILFLGILALVFSLERFLFLHKGKIKAYDFLEGIKNLLSKQRVLEAITLCQETPGSVPKITKTALLHCKEPNERILSEIQKTALIELFTLERRLGSIAVIAKITPLLGLSGTCLALCNGFWKLELLGPYSSIQSFAPNIYSALLCTLLGLAISSITFLVHYFLNGRLRALINDMEWATHEILGFLAYELKQNSAPSNV